MGLRWKIALSLAAVALVATSAVGFVGYRSTSTRLIDEIDRSIGQAAAVLLASNRADVPTRGLLGVYQVRLINARGEPLRSSFDADVPVEADALSVIDRPGTVHRETMTFDGDNFRVHTFGRQNGAVQVARPLGEIERVLDDVRRRTILLVLFVSLAAAALGWVIASSVAAPLRRLTRAAEHVGTSNRLDVDVPGEGKDEVGRLGSAFRTMLAALARSRAEQQRLVQDAGHELRTPLTSLRTNLAVLQRHPEMDAEMQERIYRDLDGEVAELTDLVNELVTVASGHLADEPPTTFDLGQLAGEVAAKVARRRSRTVDVRVTDAAAVHASRAGIERAITNIVDNACKFDGGDGAVEVVVDGTQLQVLDRGPGIAPADVDRIFDRFHRSEAARTMPGSGLGLAIVREVVERSGGTVSAANRDGGGAAIGFRLPPATG